MTFGAEAPKDTAALQNFSAKFKVTKIVVHPNYQPRPPGIRSMRTGPEGIRWGEAREDIALVFFEGSAPASAVTASLPSPTDLPLSPGNKVYVAGFGITSPGADDGGTLRWAELAVEKLNTSPEGAAEILASNPNGSDACHGDSGGPLYVTLDGGERLGVVGVVSTSRDRLSKEGCKIGTLFGDARYVRPWIAETVKQVLGR